MSQTTDNWHTITVRVPFASPQHALIAQQVLAVDSELQPHAVHRTLATQNDELIATFTCSTVRLIRLSINSFLENIELVIRTLGEFGEEAEAAVAAAATTASVPERVQTILSQSTLQEQPSIISPSS